MPITCDLHRNSAKKLQLAVNNIGDEGAKALAVALPHMNKLEDPWLN